MTLKLQIVSDLHLEFNTNVQINNAGADVLCLAGDICLAEYLYRNPVSDAPNNSSYSDHAKRYREFFTQVTGEFNQVLYIMGNHEHYNGLWNRTSDVLFEEADRYPNLTFLDDEWVDINNIRIVGTSLWTNFNNEDPLTMLSVKDMMNDYSAIKINNNGVYHKLRPIDTLRAHRQSLEFIKFAVGEHEGSVVLLGHHAPSTQSIHELYKNELLMNGAFCSNLEEFILDHDKIKLWIHGHVHNSFDYQIGSTRVVCNPHGYPKEINTFNPKFVVEVE
jgi:Icc-related predicted phosphoesterase